MKEDFPPPPEKVLQAEKEIDSEGEEIDDNSDKRWGRQ